MIPFDDRGLTLGDGLFETVLARDGDLDWWDAHVQRLIAGCAVMGLPPPEPAALEAAAQAALAQAGLTEGRAAVRLSWTAGSGGRGLDRPEAPAPRLFATAAPAPLPQGPARLIVSEVRRNEGSPASRLKSLSYADNVLARTQARARGADEAVMLNNVGEVACAAAANLFWERHDKLFTPALACGVLDGIARRQVLQMARSLGVEVAEVMQGAEALERAESVFLTNSLVGVRQVASLEGAVYEPSRLAARLAELI